MCARPYCLNTRATMDVSIRESSFGISEPLDVGGFGVICSGGDSLIAEWRRRVPQGKGLNKSVPNLPEVATSRA
jgi:hypothetical protein